MPPPTLEMPLPAVDVPQPPWTYDLEIAFFKAIVAYRPIGMHKSLRLLSILNSVNSTLSSTDTPLTLHDIKSKLNELYNIEGIEEQEESEDANTEEGEKDEKLYTEFRFPFEEVVRIVEDRGKGVDGDGSIPNSPEVMSVRSNRSDRGRGTKRRREESAAISNTDGGTEDEGLYQFCCELMEDLPSPTTATRAKRQRNVSAAQRKASSSATPAASTTSKRRTGGRWPKKEEKEEKEESEEDEAEETESVAETASVADTDGGPSKPLRTSSRRKGGQDEVKSETSGRTGGRSRGARVARPRSRTRGRGH